MEKKPPPPNFLKREDSLFTRQSREVVSFFNSVRVPYVIQAAGCAVLIVFHLYLSSTPFLTRVENVVYDFYFRLRPALTSHPAIVFVEVAEDGIGHFGRWPWPRHFHGVLTHILSEWGAKAIVFDVLFSEPSTEFDDAAFGEAISTSATPVYFPVVAEKRQNAHVWTRSIPRFSNFAKGMGHVNSYPDSDGVIRRIKPFLSVGGVRYPHLALRLAYDYKGEALAADTKLPFHGDANGDFLINWAGRWIETFKHYSYWDVLKSYQLLLDGKQPILSPDSVRGKICIVGLTATGLWDIKANPLESVYPVVGVNANVIQNALENNFIRPVSGLVNIFCLCLVGIFATVFFLPFRNVVSFALGLLLALGWIGVTYLLFWKQGIWIFVFQPMLLILSLFIFSAIYDHTIGRRERAQLFDLATRDGLTGLYVIRHFREVLNEAVKEAQIQKKPLSIIILDLDDFKKINDTYGHLAGDKVLKEIAKVIFASFRSKRPMRELDFVARYGGEEFIVMLPGANVTDTAFKCAERIRDAIERHPVTWEGKVLKITVSLGVASLASNESVPDAMVQRADEALYRAKREGKNCIRIEKTP